MGLLIFWGIIFMIVVLHELGHLLVAKKIGVRVKTYSIGFGPRIIGIKFYKGKVSFRVGKFNPTNSGVWFRKDNTEYRLAPILFGGFCDLAGELKGTGKDYEFSSRPFRQKLAVAFAGIGMNILTGFLALFSISIKNLGFIEGIKKAIFVTYLAINGLFVGIYSLFTHNAQITTASEVNILMTNLNMEYIVLYFGLFSILMALVNAIPFPALDGSLPFLWIFEKLLGKERSKYVQFIWFIGFVLLMVLQVVVLYFWIFG